MNTNNKKSFTLIELITSIFIMSLILIYTMTFYKESFSINEKNYEIEKIKLDFLNTKLFLEKRKNFHKLLLIDENLFYDNSLLLKDVTKYTNYEKNNYMQMNICIKNKLCQDIVVLK